MTLEELIDTLESANMLRIFKGDEEMKELNLMSPLKPDETPDFRFQELQMKLYYTIYL